MKFQILHEIKGRMRIHVAQKKMNDEQADTLQYYLEHCEVVTEAKVYERTQDVVICYSADRAGMIRILQQFAYQNVSVSQSALELSGRQTNREYQEKLTQKVLMRYINKVILPYPVRCTITAFKSLKYIKKALQRMIL